jgi:hypothetical protein
MQIVVLWAFAMSTHILHTFCYFSGLCHIICVSNIHASNADMLPWFTQGVFKYEDFSHHLPYLMHAISWFLRWRIFCALYVKCTEDVFLCLIKHWARKVNREMTVELWRFLILKLHGDESSAAYSDQFNVEESSPGNEWTGGQWGFRATLDLVANRKIPVLGCAAHMIVTASPHAQ